MRRFTVTRDERLDRLARDLYGGERPGTVEALLEANPGLAELVRLVPAGTVLDVPETVIAAAPAVRPWV